MFTLFWPVIRRLLDEGERQRVTSIADYMGARYGKQQYCHREQRAGD
jgi:Na+/proline symporter